MKREIIDRCHSTPTKVQGIVENVRICDCPEIVNSSNGR
jgi:hypothetical protein